VPAPVLALDIGGTKLAAGIVSPAGELLAERAEDTDPAWSPAEVIEQLFELSEAALAEAALHWRDLPAVGLSFGGPVDFPARRTITCHHLHGWEGIPLPELVEERFGLPVVMDNDANAAALGEAVFGAARGFDHVLYLTVSTGIGAGLLLNGHLHRGANSLAGELGHTLVVPDGPACTCGRNGCLEAVASGPAIAREAKAALDRGEASVLQSIPRHQLTAKHVAENAHSDPLSARIMARAGEYLGVAIAAAVNLVNPDIVVIGGGVSQAGETLLQPLRDSVARGAVPESVRDLRIVAGALGPQGALLGAAALALRRGSSLQEPT